MAGIPLAVQRIDDEAADIVEAEGRQYDFCILAPAFRIAASVRLSG
jgi:hypothetical protein